MSEWRPWVLVSYVDGAFGKRGQPPAEPPGGAEISTDGAWASLYDEEGRTPIATWMRTRKPGRKELAALTEERIARQAARIDAGRPTS